MLEFFCGWERRAGCFTLFLAFVFMDIWVWSFVVVGEHQYWCELPWGVVAVPLTLLSAWLLLSKPTPDRTEIREPLPYRVYSEALSHQIIEGDARNALTVKQDAVGTHLFLDNKFILTVLRGVGDAADVRIVQAANGVFIHADPVRLELLRCGSPEDAVAVRDILSRVFATTTRGEVTHPANENA